ncbi:MAG TPA: hypothetical protein DHV62_07090 [Elusimicrobia bacterium]|jgi:hypothetical protein|nr:hypothetical protein [Elusimicrobiota bacterium]
MTEQYQKSYVKEKQKDPNDLSSHLPEWIEMLAELYISPLKYQVKKEMKMRDKMKSFYENKKHYEQHYA